MRTRPLARTLNKKATQELIAEMVMLSSCGPAALCNPLPRAEGRLERFLKRDETMVWRWRKRGGCSEPGS